MPILLLQEEEELCRIRFKKDDGGLEGSVVATAIIGTVVGNVIGMGTKGRRPHG